MIDQETVRTFFKYVESTGEFKRIKFVNNKGEMYDRESPVSSRHVHGYYVTVVNGKRYRVHHLIFLYVTGKLPIDYVDHINGDRQDNRWENLRQVTRLGNQRNQGLRSDNSCGVIGVYWYPPLSKYHAQITVNGKRIHLGYFKNLDEAKEVRKKAEHYHGFHKNHGERESWRM